MEKEQLIQVNLLKAKLKDSASEIKNIVEQGRLIATDPSQLFLFKGMFRKLDSYFDTFNISWDKLLEIYSTAETSTSFPAEGEKSLQSHVRRYYYEASAIYESHMNPTPVNPLFVNNESSGLNAAMINGTLNDSRIVRARLPQINLPTFSGVQADWPLFRDTYTSLIHEEVTLSKIEKFHFLISCLRGPALSLVRGVPLSEANYEQAWKILKENYDDKRRIAGSYLKRILNYVPFKNKPTVANLKHLITTVLENVTAFKQLEIGDADDFILTYLVLRCLDPDTRRDFEREVSSLEFPTFEKLLNFIKSELKSLEVTCDESSQMRQTPNPSFIKPSSGNKMKTSLLADEEETCRPDSQQVKVKNKNAYQFLCPTCKSNHTLYQCTTFRNSSATEKRTYLKGWSGCFNCLSCKHKTDSCRSTRRCQTCNEKHHSWLHLPQSGDSLQPEEHKTASLSGTSRSGEVILGTALVKMKDHRGNFQTIRLVTDCGSQHSFITKKCVDRLGLKFTSSTPTIAGIGQMQLPQVYGVLSCVLRPRFSHQELFTDAIVVPNITGSLPHIRLPHEIHNYINAYELADPTYWKPQDVDFLLGADLYFELITGAPLTVRDDFPKVIPSKLGHIIAGRCATHKDDAHRVSLFVKSQPELPVIMSKFWELEELPKRPILSEEELACEAHFRATHYRLPTGRYVVALPFKSSIPQLENPSQQVVSRFLNLEHKLYHRPVLRQEYVQFMDDYQKLGHMQPSQNSTRYLIPHHAVTKMEDNKLKIRVVFDASCRGRSGSLNDHLLVGPKLQRDISDIVIGFRTHFIVLVADIVKMYRQILLRPEDRPYQHILWRSDSKEELMTMELNTVTYGVSSSAFLAIRTLLQLVEDAGDQYPLAAKVVQKASYMDDFVSGANDLEGALQLRRELISLLRLGGFELGKWKSNSSDLLQQCGGSTEDEHVSLSGNENGGCKVLGLNWFSSKDIFTFHVEKPTAPLTKRGILSTIARIYDPLGFLAPVVFKAKTILQDVWHAKCDWDERVPVHIEESWLALANDLPNLSRVEIPRPICLPNPVSYDLIGFSDASQRGYAAALYIRASSLNAVRIHLLKAKTKLSPMKLTSIPRLELCGALLLAQVLESCRTPLENLTIRQTYLFTDSTVVLGWLNLPLNRLKAFVAHKVAATLEITSQCSWHYVASEFNPADCASRGLYPNEISEHCLWWSGPRWLLEPPLTWPLTVVDFALMDLPETKPSDTMALLTKESPSVVHWMKNCSSYLKLLRSLCFALRFIKVTRRHQRLTGPITLKELEEARFLCIRLIQENYISSKETLKASKYWHSLAPFKDARGLFRVGGRLEHSKLSFSRKHPIILPDSHFTRLLIEHYHRLHLHVGPTSLQSALQNRYFIISARKVIRSRIRRCVTCQISAPRQQAPMMGNLPSYRVEEGQIFQHVGVDLGGPFLIKESNRRKAALGKAYLVLFICMVTKAVHLEVVTSCSTEAFLASLHRFTARRGKPNHLYSDCGTNFVGAAAELRELKAWYTEQDTQQRIHDFATQNEINWHFNPPHAPHFGGLWEAGIKSAKNLLAKNLAGTPLTYEELSTIFYRIEAILNSRPLCPLSDGMSFECLTPGHFLVGRPLTALPETSLLDVKENRLRRWQLVQQRVQHFWWRWRTTYLNQLQQRKKWITRRTDLKEGDLVIIKDSCSQPTRWPLGRVICTHPGSDGIVRVVTIRTPSGTYKRPVVKLVSLLLPDYEEEE